MAALTIPPLVACGCLLSAINARARGQEWLAGWNIPKTINLPLSSETDFLLDSIIRTRRNLVELCAMCSVLLLVHFLASKANRFRKDHSGDHASSQQTWLTESEIRRVWLYIGFTAMVTLGAIIVKLALTNYPYPLLKCRYRLIIILKQPLTGIRYDIQGRYFDILILSICSICHGQTSPTRLHRG